jgi:hypothetical protein
MLHPQGGVNGDGMPHCRLLGHGRKHQHLVAGPDKGRIQGPQAKGMNAVVVGQ